MIGLLTTGEWVNFDEEHVMTEIGNLVREKNA